MKVAGGDKNQSKLVEFFPTKVNSSGMQTLKNKAF